MAGSWGWWPLASGAQAAGQGAAMTEGAAIALGRRERMIMTCLIPSWQMVRPSADVAVLVPYCLALLALLALHLLFAARFLCPLPGLCPRLLLYPHCHAMLPVACSGAAESELGSEAPDSHNDHCSACGADQGQLLCCDGCPAVYHPRCCGLRDVPSGVPAGS
jgi:hypothetical protein